MAEQQDQQAAPDPEAPTVHTVDYEDEKREMEEKMTACAKRMIALKSGGKDIRRVEGLMTLAHNYYKASNYKKGMKHAGDAMALMDQIEKT